MDAGEPRVRHRGFFLHSETTGESDAVEQENPEGFVIRVRIRRPAAPRQLVGRSHSPRTVRLASGRSRMDTEAGEPTPQFRSGNVTGSRLRAHSLR